MTYDWYLVCPTPNIDQFEHLWALLSWSVDMHCDFGIIDNGPCFFFFFPQQGSPFRLIPLFIHLFEKRDVLCYGVWRPSICP